VTRYRITRYDASTVDCRVFVDDSIGYQLSHIPIHSPTGFNCGYLGAGPGDLALALLAHHFGEDPFTVYGRVTTGHGDESRAYREHQRFKQDIVANIFLDDEKTRIMTDEEIGHWLAERV